MFSRFSTGWPLGPSRVPRAGSRVSRSRSPPSAKIPSSPQSPRRTTTANARFGTFFSERDKAGFTELSSRSLRARCESFGSGDPESHRSAEKTWNNRRMPRKRGARDGSFVPAHDHQLGPTPLRSYRVLLLSTPSIHLAMRFIAGSCWDHLEDSWLVHPLPLAGEGRQRGSHQPARPFGQGGWLCPAPLTPTLG